MISRYLQRLAAIVRPERSASPAVSADAQGLQIGNERVAWPEVRRVDAYKRDIYVGDCLCLAILGAGGRIFEISEDSPGWKQAGDAIEQFLPASLPHDEWMLRLMAAEPAESVPVYAAPAPPL